MLRRHFQMLDAGQTDFAIRTDRTRGFLRNALTLEDTGGGSYGTDSVTHSIVGMASALADEAGIGHDFVWIETVKVGGC
jgi:hypothetical protein